MDNPIGYLFRVGQSRTRPRQTALLPVTAQRLEPYVEPALASLSETQRTAVVLVHGCGWTYTEVADALDITKSSVGTHLKRAMDGLRRRLNVEVPDA